MRQRCTPQHSIARHNTARATPSAERDAVQIREALSTSHHSTANRTQLPCAVVGKCTHLAENRHRGDRGVRKRLQRHEPAQVGGCGLGGWVLQAQGERSVCARVSEKALFSWACVQPCVCVCVCARARAYPHMQHHKPGSAYTARSHGASPPPRARARTHVWKPTPHQACACAQQSTGSVFAVVCAALHAHEKLRHPPGSAYTVRSHGALPTAVAAAQTCWGPGTCP